MKTFLTAALLVSFSLAAFPSEKGGNTFRSLELHFALEEFELTDSCPALNDSKATMKAICDELGEEIMMSPADNTSKRFYLECCKNKH